MANEKRLIYANGPLKQLFDYMEKLHCSTDYIDGLYRGMEIAESYIKNAPTVDAVPAVHSKWVCVNEAENVWMCDGIEGCGGEMLILEKTPLENGFGFCPYCGADMRDGDGNG